MGNRKLIGDAYTAMMARIRGSVTAVDPSKILNYRWEFVGEAKPIARAIHWMVLSHHRMPRGLKTNTYDGYRLRASRLFDPTKEADLAAVPARVRLAEEAEWISMVQDCAARLLQQVDVAQSGNLLGVATYGRLALMLADKAESKAASRRISEAAMATRLVAKSVVKDEAGNYTVALADHMSDEATLSRSVFDDLLRTAAPVVPAAEVPHKLRAASPDRFAWQNRMVEVAQKHDPEHGFFGVNLAATGTGKTIGNSKLMDAISPKGIRYTYAQGLRSLTFQAGASHRDDLGFETGRHIGIRIGSPAAIALYDATDRDIAEDAGLDNNENEPEIEDVVTLVEDGAVMNQTQHGLVKLSTLISPAHAAYISVPILLCTLDSVMGVASGQIARQPHHYVRMMTSDLIIDEIDDFSEEDQCAIGRLVRAVGAYGRKLVLTSATLPPATVEAYFRAYSEGYAEHCRFIGKAAPKIDFLWCSHEAATIRMQTFDAVPGGTPVAEQHEAFGGALVAFITAADPHRKVGILDTQRAGTMDAVYQRVAAACRQLHSVHHVVDEQTGVRVSVGAMRWANTRQTIEFARHMLAAPGYDDVRVICYHSKLLGATRYWIEKELEELLTRKRGVSPLQHPDVRRAIEQVQAAGGKDLIVVLSTSPIIEVGRDYDLDWGISDPSGLRQLIQFAGRIGRHRQMHPDTPNILLLDRPSRALRVKPGEPVFCNPGVETKCASQHGHPNWRLRQTETGKVFDLALLAVAIDARNRVLERAACPIGAMEHKRLRFHLFDSIVSLNSYLDCFPLSEMSSRHHTIMQFRRETYPGGITLVLEGGNLHGYDYQGKYLMPLGNSFGVSAEPTGRFLFVMPDPEDVFDRLRNTVFGQFRQDRLRQEIMSCQTLSKNPDARYSLQLGLEEG